MKQIGHISVLVLLVAFLSISPISCGGGGGGDGEEAPTMTLEEAPTMTLNEENVNDFVTFVRETIPGCDSKSSVTPTKSVVDSVAAATKELDARLELFPVLGSVRAAVGQVETEQTGTCGGTLVVNVSADDVTGVFSGNLDLNDFCQNIDKATSVYDGSVTFSGKTDVGTDELAELSASSDGITVTVDEGGEKESFTVGFDITMSISGSITTISTPRLSFKDGTDKPYMVQNLTITVTEAGRTSQVEFSGRHIDPDEGSVDFRTLEPLTISDDGKVLSGQIEFAGAGDTRVVITISEDNVFQVDADTNGDNNLNYTADILDCSEFDMDLDL
ncbi:MAG: hypothetical protein ACNY01_01225 [Desulfobacteria bacterium]